MDRGGAEDRSQGGSHSADELHHDVRRVGAARVRRQKPTAALRGGPKEAALAHVVKSKVERAYRRTDLFAKRVELMAAWGRYVTSAGGVIVRLAS